MKKLIFLFLSFLSLILLISLTTNTKVKAESIGVSPGKLVFDNVDNSNNDFIIYNPNDNNFDFNVYSEPLNWLRFVPDEGRIEPRGKTRVSAKLFVPYKTEAGKYFTFVYVNSNKNNNNVTLIKTGAAIKSEIIIREKTKPSTLIGMVIILATILLGVLVYKKINIFR